MAKTYSAGIATAYGAAKRGGYTGTYEDFCREQAVFAENAQQVAEDREAVENLAIQFENTAVPQAITAVQQEAATQVGNVNTAGAAQVQRVKEEVTTQVGRIQIAVTEQMDRAELAANNALTFERNAADFAFAASESKAASADSETAAAQSAAQAQETVDGALSAINTAKEAALDAVESAEDDAVQAVQTEGATQTANAKTQADAAVEDIEQAGETQVGNVNTAGTTNVGAVETAGAAQVAAVNSAGTTQVENVNSAGSTQVQAVQRKGQEVLNSIPADYTELDQDVDNLKSAISTNESFIYDLSGMEKPDYYHTGNFMAYPFPDEAFNVIGVKVFTDKRSFVTDYNPSKHKNSGGTVYYFSPDGNNSNSGLSRSSPKKTISSVISSLVDGDTIYLLPGLYGRDLHYNQVISKSVNIIGEGSVIITNSDNNYTYTSEGSNTFSTERSNVVSVLFKINNNSFVYLAGKSSLENCKRTPLSFFSDISTVYVNLGGLAVPTNENVFLNLSLGNHIIDIEATSSNINAYLENITIIGGNRGGLLAQSSASYDIQVHAYNCRFLGSFTTVAISHDAVSVLGGIGYFVNCEASYARKDGFNYHKNGDKLGYGFELNCVGSNNGHDWEDNNCNGSTCHDGGAVIRINGTYHDNKGPNVVDVQSGTKTLNLRCIAFDSTSSETGENADFKASQGGTKMWLDCCKAFGSDYSIFSISNNEMYLHNVEKVNISGGGTIDTSWNPYA